MNQNLSDFLNSNKSQNNSNPCISTFDNQIRHKITSFLFYVTQRTRQLAVDHQQLQLVACYDTLSSILCNTTSAAARHRSTPLQARHVLQRWENPLEPPWRVSAPCLPSGGTGDEGRGTRDRGRGTKDGGRGLERDKNRYREYTYGKSATVIADLPQVFQRRDTIQH